MKCLVTGAAGFIGSHLCERLLQQGNEVVGVDAFVPYYPRPIKENNLASALADPRFHFHELDLRHDPLDDLLDGVEVVFHLAAMAGLAKSWTHFELYWTCNVLATQRLLDAVRALPAKQRGAVAYHYLADLPYLEVGKLLGTSEAAARRSAADGIAALRNVYQPEASA